MTNRSRGRKGAKKQPFNPAVGADFSDQHLDVIYKLLPQPADDAEAEIWHYIGIEMDHRPGYWMTYDRDRAELIYLNAQEYADHMWEKYDIDLSANEAWRRLTTPEAGQARYEQRRRHERALNAYILANN